MIPSDFRLNQVRVICSYGLLVRAFARCYDPWTTGILALASISSGSHRSRCCSLRARHNLYPGKFAQCFCLFFLSNAGFSFLESLSTCILSFNEAFHDVHFCYGSLTRCQRFSGLSCLSLCMTRFVFIGFFYTVTSFQITRSTRFFLSHQGQMTDVQGPK